MQNAAFHSTLQLNVLWFLWKKCFYLELGFCYTTDNIITTSEKTRSGADNKKNHMRRILACGSVI